MLGVMLDLRLGAGERVALAEVIPVARAAFVLRHRRAAREQGADQNKSTHSSSVSIVLPQPREANMLRLLCIPLVAFAIAGHAQVDERKKLAFDTIERNAGELATIGDSLYYFGEL